MTYEQILQLIGTTPRKPRIILSTTPTPGPSNDAPETEELFTYTFEIKAPTDKQQFTAHTWKAPPAPTAYWEEHEMTIKHMLQYVQSLGWYMGYHPKDMQLMLEAAGKYYLWKTTYPFKDEDLDLSTIIEREFTVMVVVVVVSVT